MRLAPNWKTLARRAWSFRLMALAAILSGLEVAIALLGDGIMLPPGTFAALSGVVSAGALLARLVAQQGITRDAR